MLHLILQAFQTVLKNKSITDSDNFFTFGGNSLLAMQLSIILEKSLEITVPAEAILKHPTARDLFNHISKEAQHPSIIDHSLSQDSIELTSEQKRLWFLDNLLSDKGLYNVPWAFYLNGKLDIEKFKSSFNKVIEKHPILRSFITKNQKDEPAFIIGNYTPWNIHELDFINTPILEKDLLSIIEEKTSEHFDLSELPLFRVYLFHLTQQKSLLLFIFHHILIDLRSLEIIANELAYFYNHSNSSPTDITTHPFEYFVRWLNEKQLSNSIQDKIKAIAPQLVNLTKPIEMPYTRKKLKEMSYEGACLQRLLSLEQLKSLESFAARHNTSLFVILLASFQLLLYRYSQQLDITIGVPITQRTTEALWNTVGFCINTLPVSINIHSEWTFLEFLERVKEIYIEFSDNRYIPITQLIENAKLERSVPYQSLYQIAFTLDHEIDLHLNEIQATPYYPPYHGAKFDLTCFAKICHNGLLLTFEYATSLYDPYVIQNMMNAYEKLLNSIIQSPNTLIKQLDIIDYNILPHSTLKISNPPTFLETFKEVAIEHKNKLAVVDQYDSMSYGLLDEKSNQLAYFLLENGIKKQEKIAIIQNHSTNLIVAILGVLKMGGIYIPIAPSLPIDRKNFILDDSKPALILVDDNLLSMPSRKIINTTEKANQISIMSKEALPIFPEPQDIAYIIYTSGTTGKPKGVSVSHYNVTRLFSSTENLFHFSPSDIWTLYHSYSFDFSVWEIFGALLFGGKLLIVPDQVRYSPKDFFTFLFENKVTVLNQTPSAFQQLVSYIETLGYTDKLALRYIIFGGEALNFSLVKRWYKFYDDSQPQLINMYGITECTVHVTHLKINKEHLKNNNIGSLIGKPLDDLFIYLLDTQLQPIPVGAIGEMYIGGEGVAKGYLNNPSLNQERFIANPFSKQHDRLYKSGDLAKQLPDGNFVYLGRNDKQVKIRGFRLELQDIESQLRTHPIIDQVVVIPTENEYADKRLVAFITPKNQGFRVKVAIDTLKNSNQVKHISKLPNGLHVCDLNPAETNFLYEEIFTRNDYIKNGISVEPGDVIFDVGANIGFFSLLLTLNIKELTVYAYEPIANTFSCLKNNQKIYNLPITCLNLGLSSENGTKEFYFLPNTSAMSTYSSDIIEQQESIIEASIINQNQHAAISNELSSSLRKIAAHKSEKKKVVCQVNTLSEQIRTHKIELISLLKIDVEGAELDVLNGINHDDWNKIKQVIIEIHDIQHRVALINSILTDHGFNHIVIEQSDLLKETNIYTIFASKKDSASIKMENSHYFKKEFPALPSEKRINEKIEEIKLHISKSLPDYMLPNQYLFLSELPVTDNGKIDDKKLLTLLDEKSLAKPRKSSDAFNKTETLVMNSWKELIDNPSIHQETNFFEVGGTSLLAIKLYDKLKEKIDTNFKLIDLFTYPNIKTFSQYIDSNKENSASIEIEEKTFQYEPIAIVAMAGRFPGANTVQEFWQNILSGKETISHFPELKENHNKDNFVAASGVLDEIELFAGKFFGYSPKEAQMMDPQQRILLEVCYQALSLVNDDKPHSKNKTGVFLSADPSSYIDRLKKLEDYQDNLIQKMIDQGNSRDFIATRIAYKLNLTGPALTVNTACSSSLVAIIKACQSLLMDECAIAIAGGVSLVLPDQAGYYYEQEHILSKDGRCCPFDQHATGTVPSSGASVLVLKKLKNAIAEQDNIEAVITGYALNNDGNDKVSFIAPSVSGQTDCIKTAHKIAKITLHDIDYLEMHGTGTKLGDPIEFNALQQVAKQQGVTDVARCALGSVKANIGHAGAAAGVAGLMKAIHIVQSKQIPPQINCDEINQEIDLDSSPFYISKQPISLQNKSTLRAAVSAFGMGGTNAHIVIESYSSRCRPTPSLPVLKREHYFIPLNKRPRALQSLHHHHEIMSPSIYDDPSQEFITTFLIMCNEHLGYENISLHDNFFDLGGDSLLLLSLLTRIEKQWGINANFDTLFESKTLGEMLAYLFKAKHELAHQYNLVRLKQGDPNLPSIVLIHPGNGAIYPYTNLVGHLTLNYNIYAIQNHILNDLETPFSSIEEMAREYVQLLNRSEVTGDYILGGWSFGGTVAFEMSKQLQESNKRIHKLILLDTWASYPDSFRNKDNFEQIWMNQGIKDTLWVKLHWARLQLLLDYSPSISDICTYLIKTHEVNLKTILHDDPYNFWGPICKNGVHVTYSSGNHDTMLNQEYIASLAMELQNVINSTSK